MSQAIPLSPEYRFTFPPFFPRYCTTLLNRAIDSFHEKRLGIKTTGGAGSPHPDASHYGCLAYYTYYKIFDALGLDKKDVVVDLGSGKGRPNFIAAQYPIKESIGVEIDPPLHAVSVANCATLREARAPVRFVCQSATDFNYDDTTVIIMFHPFGGETLNVVLARIEDSLKRKPREFRIVYGNPMLSPLIAAKPWMQLYDAWNPGTWSRVKFPVHFYRSTMPTS